jgi:hypothetical protein
MQITKHCKPDSALHCGKFFCAPPFYVGGKRSECRCGTWEGLQSGSAENSHSFAAGGSNWFPLTFICSVFWNAGCP